MPSLLRVPLVRLAAPAAAAALLLSACGSSDSSTSSTAGTTPAGTSGAATSSTATTPAKPPLSRAEFIKRADKACATVHKKQTALRKESQGLPFSKLSPILRKQARLATGLATDLGQLSPPAEDAAQIKSFISSVKKIGVYSEALAGSIAANHVVPAKHLAAKLVAARTREHSLGQGYGFKVCANGSSY